MRCFLIHVFFQLVTPMSQELPVMSRIRGNFNIHMPNHSSFSNKLETILSYSTFQPIGDYTQFLMSYN